MKFRMNKEKVKVQIQFCFGKLRSALKYITSKERAKASIRVVFGTLQSVLKYIISKERAKARELIVFGILQYIFLPVLCGFLTAAILAARVFEKLGLDRFSFMNFPTIKIQTAESSTYTGLTLIAGLGGILGLVLSRILKFGARLGHFNFISPPKSLDTMPIPSAAVFIKAIIRLAGIPVIVVLGAVTALELTKTGMLPGVRIDTKYQLFEVTLSGVVIVAALGCLMMFLFDMALMTLLKLTRRKEVEIKELR